MHLCWTGRLRNLAADPAHAATLKTSRARLDRWMAETGDRGPESEAMYNSDMESYLSARPKRAGDEGEDITRENIRLMKKWAQEGR